MGGWRGVEHSGGYAWRSFWIGERFGWLNGVAVGSVDFDGLGQLEFDPEEKPETTLSGLRLQASHQATFETAHAMFVDTEFGIRKLTLM